MGSIRKHTQTGFLFFDFRYQGVRCREYTALPETAPNKKRLEKILKVIEADVAAGSFDYRRFFPGSKNAIKFDLPLAAAVVAGQTLGAAVQAASAPTTPLFKDFAETW